MPWEPTSTVVEDWGRLQVVINGVDVTFYRSAPTIIREWTDAEPFGDATAEVFFPQISPYEDFPSWLVDHANVDLWRVKPDNSKTILFEGFIGSFEDDNEGEAGLGVQVVGSLFQADFYRMAPRLDYDFTPRDLGIILSLVLSRYTRNMAAWRCKELAYVATGIQVVRTGSWQPKLTGYIADLLAEAQDEAGNHWTLHKDPGRQPTLRLKDRTTVHWTMHVGQHGITHKLSRDLVMATTTVFGEGIFSDCRWRGAKYPNLRADDAPVFDGNIINVGDCSDAMLLFEQEMFGRGWTGFNRNGCYDPGEEFWVRQFQESAGLQVDGDIGPQTWAAAFDVGSNAGDLSGAFFAPIYSKRYTEKHNYDASGAYLGLNPDFDSQRMRIERHESFGTGTSKQVAITSAKQEVERDFVADWVGTITLTADPQEGSRFDIRSGQNFKLRGHRGADRILHIAERVVSWEEEPPSVTLTVDEKARDLMTIAAIRDRDRQTTDPARRQKVRYFNASRQVEDRMPTFDCENGSGIIPRHATYQGLWNVIRIPCGRLGDIVYTDIRLETAARFAIGIFDRQVTHQQLMAVGTGDGAGNPLAFTDYWKQFPEPDRPASEPVLAGPVGLVEAWGSFDEPAGFSPGTFSDDDPMTGRLIDGGKWYYESTQPPWLWVAIFVESPAINYISGRLFQSSEPF